MISKYCHYKMAGLNLSTHHEIGNWASTSHPFGLKLSGKLRIQSNYHISNWVDGLKLAIL